MNKISKKENHIKYKKIKPLKKRRRLYMTDQKKYSNMIKKASPNSKSWINIPLAFLIGGLICTLGQGFLSIFSAMGLEKDSAGAWTSIILVFISALLTGLGVYEKIAKHAGAGTLVPITGFANAVVSSAIEAKTEGFILGVGAKIFTIAGPVILYGTAASVIYGLILFIF
jgi:stage V sporulation protein AC